MTVKEICLVSLFQRAGGWCKPVQLSKTAGSGVDPAKKKVVGFVFPR